MVRSKKSLVVIIIVGVLVVIALALVATRPDREAHREAIMNVVSKVVNSEMDNSQMDETLAAIGTMVAVSAADEYLNSNLMIIDHTFYNIGLVNYKGEFRTVSIGVMNHVFTISEDDAKKWINQLMNSYKI